MQDVLFTSIKKQKTEIHKWLQYVHVHLITAYVPSGVLTSGRTPALLLDGKRGADPSGNRSTVVKQMLYS